MSIKKVTLASLILLSLTACSSGGSGGGSSAAATKAETKNQQATQQQTAQQKAKADAEAKRLAAEKAAKEKAEAGRLAAEKAAKEKAEAERLAAEKAAKDKAEAERLAAEKVAKEKAEAERLAEEKAQSEKLELRANKLKEIADKALEMGYSEAESNEYAQSVVDQVINENFDYLYHNHSKPYGLTYKFYDDAHALLEEAGLNSDDDEYSFIANHLTLTGNENLDRLKADIAKAVQLKETRLATEKEAAEKAEAERLAAEKAAAEKAEAERLAAKARADKLQGLNEKAKAAGLSEVEAQNYANANVDNDEAVSSAALDKLVAEKARLADLVVMATTAGLSETEAKNFANTNVANNDEVAQNNLNTLVIDKAKGIKSADWNSGLTLSNTSSSPINMSNTSCSNFGCSTYTENTVTRKGSLLYNQQYSVVRANYSLKTGTINGSKAEEYTFNPGAKGLKTSVDALPSEGKAVYSGKAFDMFHTEDAQGTLNYEVDFAARTGSGSVSGLRYEPNVVLNKASIKDTVISGRASSDVNSSGSYRVEFFGPQAEEIGGKVTLGKWSYGLAGTRGDIQQ